MVAAEHLIPGLAGVVLPGQFLPTLILRADFGISGKISEIARNLGGNLQLLVLSRKIDGCTPAHACTSILGEIHPSW